MAFRSAVLCTGMSTCIVRHPLFDINRGGFIPLQRTVMTTPIYCNLEQLRLSHPEKADAFVAHSKHITTITSELQDLLCLSSEESLDCHANGENASHRFVNPHGTR